MSSYFSENDAAKSTNAHQTFLTLIKREKPKSALLNLS
jgi:hypothetical protein